MNTSTYKFDFNYENVEEPENMKQKFIDIISKVPRHGGYLSDLFLYKDFWYQPGFLEGVIVAQENFKARPNDIILCSGPKTGTTWLKALAIAIANKTCLDDKSTNPLIHSSPHECIPYLEVNLLEHKKSLYPQLPILATHIPYSALPETISNSGCKLVYICRDPKDVLVSMWHFMSNFMQDFRIEEAFELFSRGILHAGPYWDHVLEYWKASVENPERVFFMKYEDLRKETSLHVKKLARFMGFSFSLEEENDGLVEKVVEFCSFKNLSNLEAENKNFFRKGNVGDWRNFLSDEMVERIDNITHIKMKDSGFTFG
ncbi:hypothetical protein ACJIZ3_019679 [Penstemon smallii]|uniref:Sulfotransferase n=1 Tax=Penstemon smallii TaxID=265156 RepID=A0ABD3T207_9LAMI